MPPQGAVPQQVLCHMVDTENVASACVMQLFSVVAPADVNAAHMCDPESTFEELLDCSTLPVLEAV